MEFGQAKYKNATFYVRTDRSVAGRRIAKHEFPGRDEVDFQDMGKKSPSYQIEGYLLGEDYIAQRNRLRAEVNKEGAGELIHPFYGTLTCVCENIEFNQEDTVKRIITFTATFFEVGTPTELPIESVNAASNLQEVKEEAYINIATNFNDTYTINSKPISAITNAKDTLSNTLLKVKRFRSSLLSNPEYNLALESAISISDSLIGISGELYTTMHGILTIGTTTTESLLPVVERTAKTIFDELLRLFDEIFPSVNTTDKTEPSFVYCCMVKQITLAAAAGVMPVIPYDSFQQALQLKTVMVNKIDALQVDIVDIDLFQQLDNLRKAIEIYISSTSDKLALLSAYVLDQTTPAIVLSNDLYGQASFDEDLLNRNRVLHPGFVPGQYALEVKVNV